MAIISEAYFQNFLDEGVNDISKEIFESVSYQGFDPTVIRKELIKQKWSKNDLIQILTFFVVRGTSLSEKSINRSTETLANLITNLRNKGLKDRPVDKTDITIGRIVASMPEIVASIIAKYPNNCRIICKDVSEALPLYLKFSSGAALCVDSSELKRWTEWAIEQDKVINPTRADSERVENFANIQYNSTFLSTNKRQNLRTKLDLIEGTNL
jgi:hypothetical protein